MKPITKKSKDVPTVTEMPSTIQKPIEQPVQKEPKVVQNPGDTVSKFAQKERSNSFVGGRVRMFEKSSD
jgi:hypothetical protein